MPENTIIIESGNLKLEGLLENLPGEYGAVVTHPHPLYGGDMFNNIVETICTAYNRKGYTTLRFNFRGVGRSEGDFDQGHGEQSDVLAAIELLQGLGKTEIDLAGYSFGAWVNAVGVGKYDGVRRMVLVSPPVDLMDFAMAPPSMKTELIITGTDDAFGTIDMIEDTIPDWAPGAELAYIKGADHFYWGKTEELESTLIKYLEN